MLDTQRLQYIRDSIVLPANQDIAFSIVVLDKLLNTLRIIPIAISINLEPKVLSQRLNGVTGTGAFAIYVAHVSAPVYILRSSHRV
jgi:hypothetical protein